MNGSRRWKAVANDSCLRRLSGNLIRDETTPGHFLHAASCTVLAGVNYGLRLRDNGDVGSDSDSDSDTDSD